MEPARLEHDRSGSARPSHLRLGEILIRRALIDQDDLAVALALQGIDGNDGRLGRILVELGTITEQNLIAALAEQSGLPVVDLTELTPDTDVTARISREVALRFGALPLRCRGNAIVVAVAEPPTREFRRDLSRHVGARVEFVLAVPDALRASIEDAFPLVSSNTNFEDRAAFEMVPTRGTRFEPGPPLERRGQASPPTAPPADDDVFAALARTTRRPAVRTPVADAPTSPTADRVVDWLIAKASEAGATSLHLLAQPDGMRLRVRVDGVMRDELDLPEPAGATLLERIANAAALSTETKTIQRGTLRSDDIRFGPELSVTSAPSLSGRYLVIRPTRRVQLPADRDMPELSKARRALSKLIAETSRGVVLLACTDRALRRVILGSVATDPILQTRSVGCARLETERALQGVNQFDPLAEFDAVTFADIARELDHDVIVVDVDDDDDLLRSSFDAGIEHALIIAGVHDQLAADALAHARESVNPLLVASGLALVISITENADTDIVTITPQLKTAILDCASNDELIRQIRSHPSPDPASAAQRTA